MEFELNQEIELKEGKFKIVDKVSTPQGFYNFRLKDIKTGDPKRLGSFMLGKEIENFEKQKIKKEVEKEEKRRARRQEKFLKEIEIDRISEPKLYFTLGFLSKNCFLELRTVPDTDIRDCNRYFDATGKNPSEELEGYEFDDHPKTWSTKIYLRFKDIDVNTAKYLYFPDNIEGKSLILREDGFYYYNVEWCWVLIEKYGFRLARNHDIELLRCAVPLEYLSDFEEGLNQ